MRGFDSRRLHFSSTPTRYSLSWTALSGTAYLVIGSNNPNPVDWNFDGIQVEATPVATPYVETDGGPRRAPQRACKLLVLFSARHKAGSRCASAPASQTATS